MLEWGADGYGGRRAKEKETLPEGQGMTVHPVWCGRMSLGVGKGARIQSMSVLAGRMEWSR